MKCVTLLLAATAAIASAQVSVYSEFARIDAKGNVTAPESPREILSPAIARNAFSSFQVVIQTEDDNSWTFYVGQNPEDAVAVTVYRQNGSRLEPAKLPLDGKGTMVLWMDLWNKRDATVERIKVEPQLNMDNDWVIYPMEVRIMNAQVPGDGKFAMGTAAPLAVMRAYACQPEQNRDGSGLFDPSPTQDSLRFRNLQQDLALAAGLPKEDLQKLVGGCTGPLPDDPEFYLRVRDYLVRVR